MGHRQTTEDSIIKIAAAETVPENIVENHNSIGIPLMKTVREDNKETREVITEIIIKDKVVAIIILSRVEVTGLRLTLKN